MAQTKKTINEASIREQAYFIWLNRGAPIDANPEHDWAEAEAQLAKPRTKAAPKKAKVVL